uniref:Uncharacterized protein n=1 Tax=Arundo donax TaxID=35708 RepID=A0A0A9GVQ1_ARUDO
MKSPSPAISWSPGTSPAATQRPRVPVVTAHRSNGASRLMGAVTTCCNIVSFSKFAEAPATAKLVRPSTILCWKPGTRCYGQWRRTIGNGGDRFEGEAPQSGAYLGTEVDGGELEVDSPQVQAEEIDLDGVHKRARFSCVGGGSSGVGAGWRAARGGRVVWATDRRRGAATSREVARLCG